MQAYREIMMKEMERGSDEAHACVEVHPVLPLNPAIDSSLFPTCCKVSCVYLGTVVTLL